MTSWDVSEKAPTRETNTPTVDIVSSTGTEITPCTSSPRRTRDGFPTFDSEEAKSIFWDRFNHWTNFYGFVPWLTSLLNNHYHTVGFLRVGDNLGPMMQRIHGSIAKLVNDILPKRRPQFWKHENQNDYFDGCLRHPTQVRRAFRYTFNQAVRAKLVKRPEDYAHTRFRIAVEKGIARALELKAFLPDVEYARYAKRRRLRSRAPLGTSSTSL